MEINMQFAESFDGLSLTSWEFGFIRKPIDERGETAMKFISERVRELHHFEYVPNEFTVLLDENSFDKDDINEYLGMLNPECQVIIDSTTLNFSEVLILLQAFNDINVKQVDILYLEPGNYRKKDRDNGILHKRDFELSDSIIGYEGIPGHSLVISNEVVQKVVFLCGYESERIDRAMEDSQIIGENCSCVFGVPAFSPGWEMDSFDNNLSVIKYRGINGGVKYCGATNPLAVFQTLNDVFDSLVEDEQMFVVPLATKPMNIGACLFLISKPKDKVAVLYDHPYRKPGRTSEISTWHLFNIYF